MRIPAHSPLVLGLVSTLAAAQSNSSVPVIDLGYVKYAGYTNATAGINYYRGIHYAQPPTGSLRWQKPVPIESSPNYTGQTIQATRQLPACIQGYPEWDYAADQEPGAFSATPQGQSEDCLILDVLVPSSPQSITGGLPVMLQIHGGGYTVGNALSYPGDAMTAASDGGLIYVSIQYRLGLFGFLAGSDVQENGVQNAGLYDQRLAIEWVQRHIRAFGGNPSKVTIWGGSAGGGSVTYQLMAGGGLGVPPFRAAIAEYPWWQPLLNKSTQELQYRYALDASGCSGIDCLRGLSEADLTRVGQADFNASYPGTGNGYGSFWFGPVVDGEFLRDLPDVAFKKGDYYKVPLITDREGYEGAIFSNSSVTTQTEATMDVSTYSKLTKSRLHAYYVCRHKTYFQALGPDSSRGFMNCILAQTTIRRSSNGKAGSAILLSTVSPILAQPQVRPFAVANVSCRPVISNGHRCRGWQLQHIGRIQALLRCWVTGARLHCTIPDLDLHELANGQQCNLSRHHDKLLDFLCLDLGPEPTETLRRTVLAKLHEQRGGYGGGR